MEESLSNRFGRMFEELVGESIKSVTNEFITESDLRGTSRTSLTSD